MELGKNKASTMNDRKEPFDVNVVLDSDWPQDYLIERDRNWFSIWNGFESGCIAPLTFETLPNPASAIEDGNFLGYFKWEVKPDRSIEFSRDESVCKCGKPSVFNGLTDKYLGVCDECKFHN
jgi:hypothetical protein